MRTILNLILLSALCAGATAKIFNWFEFEPTDCGNEPQIDFSGLKINSNALINYLCGDVKFRKKLSNSTRVNYDLREFYYGLLDKEIVVLDRHTGDPTNCEFVNGFLYENLMPLVGKQNDLPLPPGGVPSDCTIEPATLHIAEIDNVEQLDVESKLEIGWYQLDLTFEDEGNCLGGFHGIFSNELL